MNASVEYALDSLSLFERFALYVLYTRSGSPGGDGVLWTAADADHVSTVMGCPASRVAHAFGRMTDLGILRPAAIGTAAHFILPGPVGFAEAR